MFVYNLVSFKALDCLEKLAGLWIVNDRDLFYNQVRSLAAMIIGTAVLVRANLMIKRSRV